MENISRKNIRLKNFDYSKSGAYFITMCIHNRVHLFGEIIKGELFSKENSPHKMVENHLHKVSVKFSGAFISKYVIMPDHIHFLIIINSCNYQLCDIIKWFKIVTTNDYIRGVKKGLYLPFKKYFWQRNYYEHIIRNEYDYLEKYRYIVNNPKKWEQEWGIPFE